MKIKLNYYVTKADENQEIFSILKNRLHISSRLFIKLKKEQKITCNQKQVFSNSIVKESDFIEVDLEFEEEDSILPEEIPLCVLYEDDCFLAVSKPASMVVHPTSLHFEHTLANAVKNYLKNKKKIRPINRLDKNTTGIVLFAKNEYIQEQMIQQYKKMKKEYLALVEGIPSPKEGEIEAPIARNPDSMIKREVTPDGQYALTQYMTQITTSNWSLIKIRLKTGRTHQIRVHMAFIGNPILGDTLYGTASELISRQALHAYQLSFPHPITKKEIQIIAPIPDDMKQLISTKSDKIDSK